MKVISVTVIILVGIFFTKATETNDEESQDTNSPLVSYLLAKIQRLESKLSSNSISRNTRQVEQKQSVIANETTACNK